MTMIMNLGQGREVAMKLRLGQPVHTSDGLYGELADIVVDPHHKTVTHLVVEPHHQHQHSRLVPIWLVTVDDDRVVVGLDLAHLRQLDRVSYRDYLRFGESVNVGDKWDIGTEDVMALPYWDYESDLGMSLEPGFLDVAYDRIPKGDCEIRRSSEVTTDDHHHVGHVEGFLADDDHLVAVVVRTGIPGLRHNVVVPISKVASVRNDEIALTIDKGDFGALPAAEGIDGPMGGSHMDELQHHAAKVAGKVREGLTSLVGRAKGLVGRSDG